MPAKKSRRLRKFRWYIWAPLLLLGVVIGCSVALFVFFLPEPSLSLNNNPSADAVKERLELYGKRADDIQRLLSILLGASAIYGFALALSAYAQVRQLTDQAKSQVKDSTQEIDTLVAKTKADAQKMFPIFEDIEVSIETMMHHLLTLLPRLDIYEKTYSELPAEEKEKIFYYEKSVSALELFNIKPFSETVSGIFHGLGSFYALKYLDKKVVDDLGRSIFYLEKAIELDKRNTSALNDRAYLALVIDPQPDYASAQKYFNQSLRIDDDQQRPRYNLACIAHLQKEYRQSVEHIVEALSRHKWQIKPDAKRQLDLYYQRACSYVQLGIAQGTNAVEVDYFERAVEDLKEIAKNPATDWINILKPFCKKGTKDKNGREIGDKDEGGDLYPLKSGDYASPTEQERLNRVRKEAQEIFDQFLAKKKFTN